VLLFVKMVRLLSTFNDEFVCPPCQHDEEGYVHLVKKKMKGLVREAFCTKMSISNAELSCRALQSLSQSILLVRGDHCVGFQRFYSYSHGSLGACDNKITTTAA